MCNNANRLQTIQLIRFRLRDGQRVETLPLNEGDFGDFIYSVGKGCSFIKTLGHLDCKMKKKQKRLHQFNLKVHNIKKKHKKNNHAS